MTPENQARLDAARLEEKHATKLRREGKHVAAIAAYETARDLYVNSGAAFEGETELASEVQRAIKRCGNVITNIRHPKEKRPSAKMPRPNCLTCDKPLRRYRFDERAFDDGTPQEWGDYGDNRFCGLTCGWRWACRHAPMPKLAVRSEPPRASNEAERKTS